MKIDWKKILAVVGGLVILAYQRHGQKCAKGHVIHRAKVAARSAHFCPVCQKLIS